MLFSLCNALIELLHVNSVRIRLDFSLVIALIMLEWYLVSSFIPIFVSDLSLINQIIIAISINGILIVSLLIHEFAHYIVASLVGIKIQQTILFIYGGSYETSINEENKQNSFDNFKIAIAGPVASITLAILFAIAWFLEFQEVSPKEVFLVKQAMSTVLVYASIGNGLLALVNIIPLFPLDGAKIVNFLNRKRVPAHSQLPQLKIAKICFGAFVGAGIYFLFFSNFYIGVLLLFLVWNLWSGIRGYDTTNSNFKNLH